MVEPNSAAAAVAERLLAAFAAADLEGMRSVLDPGLVAYIANAGGGVDRVEGADGYLSRVEAMDLRAARFSIELTQAPVEVGADQVLLMVEIRAQRGGRTLHNFAAHLLRLEGGRVTEWWMTDAKPAESDAFWS